jgi:hypothetical protein
MPGFQLQDRANPKRTCQLNQDTDRSSCCGAEIVYFETDYDNGALGGYEGCEACGAMQAPATRYPDVVVELVGQDGNAFNILAIVNRALKSYGIEKDERDAFMAEARAGDYDHLLRTCMKWVTVE